MAVCLFQVEASDTVETADANDIHIPVEVVEVTGGHMRPVVVLERMVCLLQFFWHTRCLCINFSSCSNVLGVRRTDIPTVKKYLSSISCHKIV